MRAALIVKDYVATQRLQRTPRGAESMAHTKRKTHRAHRGERCKGFKVMSPTTHSSPEKRTVRAKPMVWPNVSAWSLRELSLWCARPAARLSTSGMPSRPRQAGFEMVLTYETWKMRSYRFIGIDICMVCSFVQSRSLGKHVHKPI